LRWAWVLAVGQGACLEYKPREPPPRIAVSEVFGRVPDCGDAGIAASAPSAALPLGTGKVVIISVDGLRPDAVFRAPAPAILAQACKGAYTWQARTIFPSLTLPSHASMISGVPAEQHGIYHNDNDPFFGAITVPTVLGLAKQAGKRVVVVVGKEKLGQLTPPPTRDVFRWIPAGDDAVVDAAIAELPGGFDLLFVHLAAVDIAGHVEGWMTEPYLTQVRRSDQAVGRLLGALPPDATVILTADHGGAGYIHGTAVAEDASIPWIIQGPGIPPAHALATLVQTTDTAATAAHVLGLHLPAEAPARPILEAWPP
jgi:hypothetical protein